MAVDEMYLENLDEFVNDENRIVTYKWLSRQLSVHVNQAKQMLYTFVEKQRNKKDVDLNVTYFVAGGEIKKDGTKVQKVLVVPEENLDATKTSLSPLTSCHIYSIQKAKLKDSNALYIADYDTLKENIFNSNKYSAITCTTAKPRSQEEIVRLSAKAQPTTQAVSFSKPNKDNGTSQPKLPVKPANIAGMFAQAGAKKKDGNKEKEKTNTEKKTEEKPKQESKSKPKQGGVMSFFQKQANKPASVKPDIKKESPTKLPEKKEEEKEVKKVQKEVKKEEKKSEKAKSSTGNRKKKADSSDEEGTSRKPQTKRRRIKAAIVDSSSSEEDMDDEPESPIPPTPPRASSPPVPDSPTKGETSDEDIDEEAEQTSARDTQPSQSETAPSDGDNGNDGKRRRKRRRKQVTKTTVDEDGFMTTEKVWESDSTDASETEAPVKVAPPTVTTKQQPKKPADKNKDEEKKKTPPKKSAVSKGAGKQMSMMNFFKKK